MKPTPKNWPRLSSALFYKDASPMIDWLCKAFGFTVRIKIVGDDGKIHHSELEYGEALIMVSEESAGEKPKYGVPMISPLTAGGDTQSLMLFVDDVDAHCAHARACGARIVSEPSNNDYGTEYWEDRSYGVCDPENHHWWFTQRIRDQP
jgi:uncharacterized glyoxalase superfamily protein PhnB